MKDSYPYSVRIFLKDRYVLLMGYIDLDSSYLFFPKLDENISQMVLRLEMITMLAT